MKNKLIFLAILVCMLMFGLFFVSCDNGTGGGGAGDGGTSVGAFVGIWTGIVGADAILTIENTTWVFVWPQTTGDNRGTYTVSNNTATFLHMDEEYSHTNGQLFGTATVNGNFLLLNISGTTYTLTRKIM